MRSRSVVVVVVVVAGLVCAAPCRADTDDGQPMLLSSEASALLFETGRTQLLRFRVYEAEHTFRRLLRQPDGEAAARFHLAKAAFLKGLVTDEQVYFDQFVERADSLLDHLDGLPGSTWATYLRAETQLYRAVSEGKMERKLRAALAGRKAYAYFEDVLEADSTFYDAYVGMGVLHLLIGSLPSTYRSLLRILGYGGSVEQGLRELRLAAARSRLGGIEARIYLALTDILLNNSSTGGLEALAALYREHPEGPLFSHLYGYALLMNRHAREAERLLRSTVQDGRKASYFYIDYTDYYLAQALFRLGRHEEAEAFYRHYLERHRGPALKALAYLELGHALEMQGKRREALRFYARVRKDRSYDSDAWAYRTAQARLAAPMTPLQRQVLLGRNAYDAGDYAQAEQLLRAAWDAPDAGPDLRAEAAYQLGRVYQAQGRTDDALGAFNYVLDHPSVDPQARWGPWSHFYIGEIHARQGDVRQATRAFEAALAFNRGFDYHQSLEQQAKAALERLRGDG